MVTRTSRRLALAALAVSALAACGSNAPDSVGLEPAAADADFPVTVASARGPLTLEERPERIVSLSPTATENLFAVGAGEQVVAVDDQSDFPEDAPKTSLSGFTPNVEAVAAYRPDLVVVSDDLGGIVDALTALEVPVLLQPAAKDLDEAYAQMEAIGSATGHGEEAEELVQEVQERIEAAIASVPASAKGLKVFHELDKTLFTATSRTFVGSVEKAFGLVNVADAAAGGNDYPQLSAEALVAAAPDVVVLADTDCCGQTAETFAARPGFAAIPAVREGRVIEADDDTASRWGPRIADFAEQLAAALGGRATS